MAFWNRKKAPRTIEVKAIGDIGDPIRKFLMYGASNVQTAASAISLYEESTAVAIPVNRIARLFSALEPVLKVGNKKIDSHPLLSFLKNPCPEFSRELLFEALATYYLVTGEAFMLIIGSSDRPQQIYPISPAIVNHDQANGMVVKFKINGNFMPGAFDATDDGRFLSEDELSQLVQIRAFNPYANSMIRGRSRLSTASNTARQQVLGVKHNLSILENGGRISLVFHFENDIDKDDFKALKKRIEDQFTGPENAGQVLVTSGGRLNVDSPGMSNLDMDWTNAQRISFETLLLTYDLPLALFTTAASTYDNYRTGLEAIYDDAVIPLSKIIFGHISKALFEKFNIGEDTTLTFDEDKVTALVMRRNNEVKLRKEIAIETDNELRGIIGREPYQGGDIMYKPSSEIPVGTDILTEDDDITDPEE